MHHRCRFWIWLLVAYLHHTAHTCVPGSTREITFISGIDVSPLLNADRNEVDMFLNFVGEPPLPTASVYTETFSSATHPITSPSAERPHRSQIDRKPEASIASKAQPQVQAEGGKNRRRSTDAVVDTVLQTYKRILEKTAKSPLECQNNTTILPKDLCALWAGRVVDSVLRSTEPPSTRKSFAKRIVKNFLSQERLLVLENDWLEHLEGVLCNCYYTVVKTVAEVTRCHECKVIPGDIVFAFLVEDLLRDILFSQHEKYVSDAVGKLLELSGISNAKHSVWEALFTQKQNLDSNKKIRIEGKKTSKKGKLSEKSLLTAVSSDAVIGDNENSKLELTPHDTARKWNQKRSIQYDYEGTEFAGFRKVPLVSESEDENSDRYFDSERNWKQISLKQSRRSTQTANGSPSIVGYRDAILADSEHPEKAISPTMYDVTFSSTDVTELTRLTRAVSKDGVEDRVLERRKKHYHPQLKDKNTHFVDKTPKIDMGMLKGRKTNDFSLSEESNEENNNKNSQKKVQYNEDNSRNIHVNSYTDSEWSPFFSALVSWIQFPEKMKGSGDAERALGSNAETLHSNKTNSTSGSKFTLSEGIQRTGTNVRTGDTNLNLIRRGRQISYQEAVIVVDLAKELAKMASPSQEKEETRRNEHGEDTNVDTQSALDTGGAAKETTQTSYLRAVTDFLSKLPEKVLSVGLFFKSQS